MKAIHTLTLVCLLGANLLPSIAAQNPHIEYHSTAQGLKYRVIQAGNGIKPKLNDEVEIRFISYNTKGEILDGTLNGVPMIMPIDEHTFSGLKQSLLLMSADSIYEFDIPAHLGYSEEGRSNKQAARYRIELLRVNP